MPNVTLSRGYVPGAIGRVTELHGAYYAKYWNFGAFFEAKAASEMAEFFERYDEMQDGFWTAHVDSRVEGCITIDGLHASQEGVHLRWFILSDSLRGSGVGNQLIGTALHFCRAHNYESVYLWTFEGLNAANTCTRRAGSGW